jgi:serine/threonine protein kinase
MEDHTAEEASSVGQRVGDKRKAEQQAEQEDHASQEDHDVAHRPHAFKLQQPRDCRLKLSEFKKGNTVPNAEGVHKIIFYCEHSNYPKKLFCWLEARRPRLAKFLEEEAKIMSTMKHAQILPVIACGPFSETYVMITELMECDLIDMAAKMSQNGTFTGLTVKGWVRQILLALIHLHDLLLVHQDVKADNLLIDPDGNVKLTDFGFCVRLPPSKFFPRLLEDNTRGTVGYMAPEMIRGPYDTKVDLFALGMTIYQFCTGQPPFWGHSNETIQQKMRKALYEFKVSGNSTTQISQECDQVPNLWCKAIIQNCLSVDPNERMAASDLYKTYFNPEGPENPEDSQPIVHLSSQPIVHLS